MSKDDEDYDWLLDEEFRKTFKHDLKVMFLTLLMMVNLIVWTTYLGKSTPTNPQPTVKANYKSNAKMENK